MNINYVAINAHISIIYIPRTSSGYPVQLLAIILQHLFVESMSTHICSALPFSLRTVILYNSHMELFEHRSQGESESNISCSNGFFS